MAECEVAGHEDDKGEQRREAVREMRKNESNKVNAKRAEVRDREVQKRGGMTTTE